MPVKPQQFNKLAVHILILSCLTLASCQGDSKQQVEHNSEAPAPIDQSANVVIRINQLGFLPDENKVAVIVGAKTEDYSVYNASTMQLQLSGQLSEAHEWPMSGEMAQIADLSELNQAGEYLLELADKSASSRFVVTDNLYADIHDASLKAYYFNRASTALSPEFAGKWSRASGHPDTQVMIHHSAASKERPAGTLISAPKGWYDAGDYGKYVVNSGISTYTLLLAYSHFNAFYAKHSGNIPESTDQVPDILNEISWNLDWLEAMQDPNDGGVYHKLTTLRFTGSVMPDQTTEQRYVVQKSTAGALNFAGVMAFSSQIYAEFTEAYPGKSQAYKKAAIAAWQWALANPEQVYKQPEDVKTGAYGDNHLADEFAFAAAQLFVLTQEPQYLAEFKRLNQNLSVPNWGSTAALGYYTLLTFAKDLVEPAYYQQLEKTLLQQAEQIVNEQQGSAYQVPMLEPDFVWGSNAVAMNKAMLLLIANQYQADPKFRNGAIALTDYILGRNPTGYAYVTGFGHKSPMKIHHRPSEADGVVEPVPGFVAGGPQNGWQDKCIYPSKLPAASYLDDYCSYSTNEITINWNAPLVYVLAGLQAK